MSNRNYTSTLRLEIKNSPGLTGIVIAMHAGAFIMLIISGLPVIVKVALTTMVVVSLLVIFPLSSHSSFFRFRRQFIPSVKSAVWNGDDSWSLKVAGSEDLQAELSGSSFVHPQLTIVNLKLMDQPWYRRYRSLVFLPDNIDAESFRRLRIRLQQFSSKDPDNSLALK